MYQFNINRIVPPPTELIRSEVPIAEKTICTCSWSREGNLHRIEYKKECLVGEGGQKKCWKISVSGFSENFVLLEYRYPESISDDIFNEEEESNKASAFEKSFQTSKDHADEEIAILRALDGSSRVLKLEMIISPDRKDNLKSINAITQYCNKGNLRGFINGGSHLSHTEKFYLTYDLLTALVSTGNKGIFIADIKEDNVLLDDSTGQLRAVICDFGFSKTVNTMTQQDVSSNLVSMLKLIFDSFYKNEKNTKEYEFILNEIKNSSASRPAEVRSRWVKKFIPGAVGE